jgi:hypothetical protein
VGEGEEEMIFACVCFMLREHPSLAPSEHPLPQADRSRYIDFILFLMKEQQKRIV